MTLKGQLLDSYFSLRLSLLGVMLIHSLSVAGLRTTAEKTVDGKHFIVNGSKKWITNGVFSDYFITGVKTGMLGFVAQIP